VEIAKLHRLGEHKLLQQGQHSSGPMFPPPLTGSCVATLVWQPDIGPYNPSTKGDAPPHPSWSNFLPAYLIAAVCAKKEKV